MTDSGQLLPTRDREVIGRGSPESCSSAGAPPRSLWRCSGSAATVTAEDDTGRDPKIGGAIKAKKPENKKFENNPVRLAPPSNSDPRGPPPDRPAGGPRSLWSFPR